MMEFGKYLLICLQFGKTFFYTLFSHVSTLIFFSLSTYRWLSVIQRGKHTFTVSSRIMDGRMHKITKTNIDEMLAIFDATKWKSSLSEPDQIMF